MKRRYFVKSAVAASGMIVVPMIITTGCTSEKNGKAPPSNPDCYERNWARRNGSVLFALTFLINLFTDNYK